MLATINLQSQHDLQLLSTFLFTVQVSLARALLRVSVGILEGSGASVSEASGALDTCTVLGVPQMGEKRCRTQLLLPHFAAPVAGEAVWTCSELLLCEVMHEYGFLPLEKGPFSKL